MGLSVGYPIMQCGLAVAGLWGVLVFHEIKGGCFRRCVCSPEMRWCSLISYGPFERSHDQRDVVAPELLLPPPPLCCGPFPIKTRARTGRLLGLRGRDNRWSVSAGCIEDLTAAMAMAAAVLSHTDVILAYKIRRVILSGRSWMRAAPPNM